MVNLVAASPLKDEAGEQSFARLVRSGLELRENPGRVKLLLVSDGANASTRGITSALGAGLPESDDAQTGDDPCCIRLGPNRWLICCERAHGLRDRLMRTAAGLGVAANDVSDGYVSITVSGRLAYDLLVRGCEQDLHRRVFGRGRFAITEIAAIEVIIHATTHADGYELLVDRSLAVDLWMWLKDRARDLIE